MVSKSRRRLGGGVEPVEGTTPLRLNILSPSSKTSVVKLDTRTPRDSRQIAGMSRAALDQTVWRYPIKGGAVQGSPMQWRVKLEADMWAAELRMQAEMRIFGSLSSVP